MIAAALIHRAGRAGVRLWRDGDRLRYAGKSDAVADLLPHLKAYKSELLEAIASGDGQAQVRNVEQRDGHVPKSLSGLAKWVCLWRLPGTPAIYMVTGPDHDLREQHPSAIPLFDEAHRDRLHHGVQPGQAIRSDDESWRRELRSLLETVYPDDEGTICEELCRAEECPSAALKCYRHVVAAGPRLVG